MKKVAIVTGATGGIGKEFVKELLKETLDEIWVIGRNMERLHVLQNEFGEKIIPVCRDLTNTQDLESIQTLLTKQAVCISYLINNAGIARMKESKAFSAAEIEQTISLNCTVPTILINYCIPYMRKGSRILNLSSAASFQPVPYINLYASTKAFERSYSRALHVELKPLGITVTAVCPSWVDTKLLTKELNGKTVQFHGIVSPDKVAQKAMRDTKRNKDMSICSFYVNCQHLNVKLMPQQMTMKLWMREIRKYL